MKKRAITVFLVLILCLGLLSAPTSAADRGFEIIEINGYGMLTKYTGPGGNVIIPDDVRSIGESAFEECTSLTSVTIPDSVDLICWTAFKNCTNLVSVTIPDSVTSIYSGAFSGCASLASVTIPVGVRSLDGYTFYRCASLTSVTIPNGVTSIGTSEFWGCTSLTRVTIPNSVTEIGIGAFSHCVSLTNMTIPDGVEVIDDYAFSDCTSLTRVTIPASVTSIGNDAFSDCTDLTVYGYTGTEAETYCKNCGIPFVSINSSDLSPKPTESEPPVVELSAPPTTPASELFNDVVKDSWYEPGVTYVVVQGLFKGMAVGVFSPDLNMNRAMVMTVLARIDGQDTTNASDGPWYTNIVNWAVAEGISDGTMPEESVRREELVTMLYRYAKSAAPVGDLTAYADGNSVSPWAENAMVWAVDQGILTGKNGGLLDPRGFATRAEVAVIFQRFVEKTGK